MKIIFDSEDQKEKFYRMVVPNCPGELGIEEKCYRNDCRDCWQQAIETEVKPNESNL